MDGILEVNLQLGSCRTRKKKLDDTHRAALVTLLNLLNLIFEIVSLVTT